MSRVLPVVLALIACSQPMPAAAESSAPAAKKMSKEDMQSFEIDRLNIELAKTTFNKAIEPFQQSMNEIVTRNKLNEGDRWEHDGTIVRAPKVAAAKPATPAPAAKTAAPAAPTKPAAEGKPTAKPEDAKK